MLTPLSKVSVLMFLLVVSACKSPPPVQSQRPEPAAWAMEKAQDLQQMLNSIITVSEVEIDRITAQVNYLQEYIRAQCLK
ncbi:outer membrane lipoprotein Rz1 [Escherichia coli]|uniref:Outer membrane lipoprotein Rz1 n=1 Tax=Escherichia coli TaxID=562 RepID=A0A2X3KNV2_ECOLX|nr:outer membrane lipoprotein Rz1 [Escherichia coli]